jgi:hypothetical protein
MWKTADFVFPVFPVFPWDSWDFQWIPWIPMGFLGFPMDSRDFQRIPGIFKGFHWEPRESFGNPIGIQGILWESWESRESKIRRFPLGLIGLCDWKLGIFCRRKKKICCNWCTVKKKGRIINPFQGFISLIIYKEGMLYVALSYTLKGFISFINPWKPLLFSTVLLMGILTYLLRVDECSSTQKGLWKCNV